MELKYIVYVTVNLCNGKLYFGVHRTNPKVFDGYIGNGIYRECLAKLDLPFHKAVKKYGYNNFRRITISIFPDTDEGKEAAYKLEEEIVNETLLKSKYIYNVSLGGVAATNDFQMKRVYQFSLNGNFMRSYQTAHEAAIILDPENVLNTTHGIALCCRGDSYSCKGYFWSYFKEFMRKEDFENTVRRRKRAIAQYALDGTFIRKFDNIKQARVETGLTNIYYAISNEASVGNFQWRWYTSDDNIKPFESIGTRYRTRPIIMVDQYGNEVEFESIKQCIKVHPEFSSKGISCVIHGINQTQKGCKFKWKDNDIVLTDLK